MTSSISMTNYSPPSSGNHRSLFVKPAKRGKQRAGGEALFAPNHFTFNYQQLHHPKLTPKQLPPFLWLTTPLPLRGTIGRCSWSLRNEESKGQGERPYLPFIILHFVINHATLTIISPRNSVRVVLLIARGWRGTSLPRVNVRKEIQRHRCWAFSMKACLQWNL